LYAAAIAVDIRIDVPDTVAVGAEVVRGDGNSAESLLTRARAISLVTGCAKVDASRFIVASSSSTGSVSAG